MAFCNERPSEYLHSSYLDGMYFNSLQHLYPHWDEHCATEDLRAVESIDPSVQWQNLRQQLEITIASSGKHILSLTDDFDGEGSPGYQQETFERATEFIQTFAAKIWDEYREIIECPDFNPAHDGSIDVHWKNDKYELLLNIPADTNEPCSFYGDDYGENVVKGKCALSVLNVGLIMWLRR